MSDGDGAPAWVGDLLRRFAAGAGACAPVQALWLHGSLALGGFVDGRSDIDLVALTARPLSRAEERELISLHRRLVAADPRAAALHCAYLDAGSLAPSDLAHPAWAHRRWLRRPVGAAVRLELLAAGRVLHGPAPADVLPAQPPGALREAARRETLAFWTPTARRSTPWLRDAWVEAGLTGAARALALLEDDAPIGKDEAIARLAGLGVPGWLVADLAARRAGHGTAGGPAARLRRARVARREMRRLLALLADAGGRR